MHGMHQHNSQGTCPVHGHEPGHHHGSPRDHAARPGRLPFDGITPRAGPLSEYRGVHSHHQRMRDEIYGINRIPVEVSYFLANRLTVVLTTHHHKVLGTIPTLALHFLTVSINM